jgi:hypothetical protein
MLLEKPILVKSRNRVTWNRKNNQFFIQVAEFRNIPCSSVNKQTGYEIGGRGSVPVWTFTLKTCSVVHQPWVFNRYSY